MLKVLKDVAYPDFLKVIWKCESGKQEYDLSWDVCKNPFCSCAKVVITLHANENCLISFKFDIETDEIKNVNDETSDIDIAKQFVNELTCDDRMVLIQLFKSKKVQIVKDADLTQFELPEFRVEKIEYESSMVGYDEIFPFNEEISFTVDSVRYLVADQYCLNTRCKCTSAMINIIAPPVDSFRPRFTQAAAVLYDYKNGKWDLIERGCVQIEPAVLVKAMKEQCPKIDKVFAERKLQLKELYTRYRAKFQSSLQQKTVHKLHSRNDPCPCGSGKKFKKCCGK